MKKIKFYITERAFSVSIGNIKVQGSGSSFDNTLSKMVITIGGLVRIYDGCIIKKGEWIVSLFSKGWIELDIEKYIEVINTLLLNFVERQKKDYKILTEAELKWNLNERIEGNLSVKELGLA